MGSIAIPSSGRTHYVVISRGNSNGAYILITDMYNNVCQRLSSNNGYTITIGGITYTGKGIAATYKPMLSISENGIIYTPIKSWEKLNRPKQHILVGLY